MADGCTDTIEVPTLGRPFRIGMLYDRRCDTFIPGVTLWDLDALRKNLDVEPKPYSNFSIICSDSIEDKASSLDVEASLKASFLGGLVEVSGSAKYLNDTKTSKQQARVTLNYRATTRFEQLTMSQLGPKHISYPSVFDQGSATHVVTAVLYGAQAFFVFDRQYTSSDNKQDIEGSLQVMIKKIPSFYIEGKGSVKLSDAEKKIVEKFSCKFHGDFLLDRNPVSYQDALQVYSTLPKLLGDHGEKAVPMRVWLYPLRMLDSRAAQIVREISIGLVNRCQLVLDQFCDLEMSCNDLINDSAAREFPELKAKVQTFKEMCLEYQAVFQKDLAGILPSIRGTGKDESELVDILELKEQSPFSNSSLTTWVEKKAKEMSTVDVYLAMLEGVDILTKSQLDRVLMDPMIEQVVCFTFTSLWDPDAFLQELSSYLRTPRSLQEPGRTSQDATSPPNTDWFEVESVSQQMRQRARLFLQFTESNKSYRNTQGMERCKIAIASVDDKSCIGASNFLYEQGILVNKEFKLEKPDIPLISGRTGCSVTLQVKAPGDNIGQVLRFWVGYRCVEDKDWSWQDTRDDTESFTVSGLHPHKAYQFRFAPVYKPWVGLLSDATASVLTLPAASPGELSVFNIQPTSLTVTWAPPARLGEGVNIGHYIVEYQKDKSQEGPWTELRTESGACECSLANLTIATCYRIRVSADCGAAGVGAPSQEVVALTPRERSPAQLAERVRRMSRLVKDGRPAVYQFPLIVKTGGEGKYRWRECYFGEAGSSSNHRKIVVFGQEESVRSDLINGLINYILGVDWADPFRFQITDGTEDQYRMTRYEINHQEGFRVPYSLTIVEASEISEDCYFYYLRMWLVFDNVNFVCVATRSSDLSLWEGGDQWFEMFKIPPKLLITYCDDQVPAVLGLLQNCGIDRPRDGQGDPSHFKLNFSGLFAANSWPDPTAEDRGEEGEGAGPGGSGTTAQGRGGGNGWNYNVRRLYWDISNDSIKRFLMELDWS